MKRPLPDGTTHLLFNRGSILSQILLRPKPLPLRPQATLARSPMTRPEYRASCRAENHP